LSWAQTTASSRAQQACKSTLAVRDGDDVEDGRRNHRNSFHDRSASTGSASLQSAGFGGEEFRVELWPQRSRG